MSSGAQPAVFLFPTGIDIYSTKVNRGDVISGEGPYSVPLSPAYAFYLAYAPQSGTIALAGYTEVTGTPGANQFQAIYSGTQAGLLTFNGVNAGDGPLLVSYTAFGDIARAFYFNDLQQSVDTIEAFLLSGTSPFVPTSGGSMTGDLVMNGASILPSVPSGNDIGTAAAPFSEIHAVNFLGSSFTDESTNSGFSTDNSGNSSLTSAGTLSISANAISGTSNNEIYVESSGDSITLKALVGQVALVSPTITSYGDVVPASSGTNDLGAPSLKWDTIYANNIDAPIFVAGVVQKSGDSMTGDLSFAPPAKIRTNLIQNYDSALNIQSTGADLNLQGDTINLNSNSSINLNTPSTFPVTLASNMVVSDAVISINTDIVPQNSGVNNLGAANAAFDNVYANNFVGLNLSGNFVSRAGDSMYGSLVMGNASGTGTQPSIVTDNIDALTSTLTMTVGELAVTAANNIHFDIGPSGTQKLEIGLAQIYISDDLIPTTDSLYDLGSPTNYYNNLYARNIHASGFTSGIAIGSGTFGNVTITGSIVLGSGASIYPLISGAATIGSSGNPIGTIYANNVVTTVGTGIYVSKFGDTMQGNLFTSASGVNDIGSAAVPFNAIYANNIENGFVHVTGDTMTGPLTISQIFGTGNLTLSGNSNINVFANQIVETAEQVNLTSSVGPIILDGNTEIQLIVNSVAKSVISQSGTQLFDNIFPNASGTLDVGSPSLPFHAIYADFFVPTNISGTGNFVQKIGDSMTGNLTMLSGANHFTSVSGINDIGSSALPWRAVYADNFYMGGVPFGGAFVHTTGDTMSGDLNFNGGNITGYSSPFTIYGANSDLNLNGITGVNINAFLGNISVAAANGNVTVAGKSTIIGGGVGSTNINGGTSGVYISGQSGPVRIFSSSAPMTLETQNQLILDSSANTYDMRFKVGSAPGTYISLEGQVRVSGNVIPAASGSYTMGTVAAPFSGAYINNINGRQATFPVYNEIPAGTVNGINAVFTTAFTPTSGTERLYRAGLRMTPYAVDYSMAGSTITFVVAPPSGDNILIDYEKPIS